MGPRLSRRITFRRSPQRRPGDLGIDQSAFVGFLVAVILLITTFIVAFGPQIGGAPAEYWLCELTGSANCTNPNAPRPTTGPDGPTTISPSIINLGPANDPVVQDIEQYMHGAGSLSLGNFLNDLPTNLMNLPALPPPPPGFQATLVNGPDDHPSGPNK